MVRGEEIKERLKNVISESGYRLWIEPLTIEAQGEGAVRFICPNRFMANWIAENYQEQIKKVVKELGGQDLLFQVREEEAEEKQLFLPYEPARLLGRRLCDRYTFDEFVVGDSNYYAYSACYSLAQGDPNSKILYLFSKTGLGKSHLSQAIGHHVLREKRDLRVCYLTAQDFTNQMVRAIKTNTIDRFKERFRQGCDILMLEEVHFLTGKDYTQAELALTLDYLFDDNKAVVFTSTAPPREIPKIQESLRSRLSAGLITSINPPDYQTRVKIIERKARRQKTVLSEEVIHYLATSLTGDIRQIEGAIVGLLTRASLLKHPVDLDLAREVVRELVGDRRDVTKEKIIELVCRYFQVSRDELRSPSRRRSVSYPRQMAMYLCRKFTGETLEAIGRMFNRDHATVVHALNTISRRSSKEAKTRYQLEYLCQQIEDLIGETGASGVAVQTD
ncbi:MAG TPA: chromosomal replication initiator protein DnaA [Thermodesulfatator sp.]|nr:chromosomal replication initiator protein DnaA [Thermodesulfatator sp.]